jgi:hypothetical protein
MRKYDVSNEISIESREKIHSISKAKILYKTKGVKCHLFQFVDQGVEVEVNLRPTVSWPVCLVVRHPSGTRDQFFFLLEISCRQLWVCYFVAPSLTRGRNCHLLYIASGPCQRSKSRRTHGNILLSHLRLPQPAGPGPRI